MLTACLREGQTFQRGEVEHMTPGGEVRHLGVTISPIYRARGARRGPVRARIGETGRLANKRRRALPDERFDRIDRSAEADPLEGKSGRAWRNVRRNRARVQKRAGDHFRLRADDSQGIEAGRHSESAGSILDQTRALTHVVTEFLRFAKPLEICYEPVRAGAMVERVAEELRETVPQCTVDWKARFQELPGDEALIRQALVNLIRNAAEATRD